MSRAAGVPVGNGHVVLHEPTPNRPYYRLDYRDQTGQRHQPNVGRSPAAALARAQQLDAELSHLSGGQDDRTLGDLMDEYLSTPVGRHRSAHGRLTGRNWSPSQYASVRGDLRRAVAEVRELPAWQLDRATIDHMRTACGTMGQVSALTGRVRCFLRWCEEQGALTREQVALLPATLAPVKRPRYAQPAPRPQRLHVAPLQGRSEAYIDEEDCPTRQEVLDLAAALGQRVPAWGELAVHLAVGCGLREGEQFQLRADDLRPVGDGEYDLHVDWQWSSVPGRRSRPKHGKRRIVPLNGLPTRDGYPLLEALLARAEAARAERAAGRNPEALLFPAPRGGMWWSTSLSTKRIVPAMKSASWAFTMVQETRTVRGGRRKTVAVTQMHRTWHSLRHRFARDMIDYIGLSDGALMAIGGWADLDTVRARYYRTGAEHLQMARAQLRRRADS